MGPQDLTDTANGRMCWVACSPSPRPLYCLVGQLPTAGLSLWDATYVHMGVCLLSHSLSKMSAVYASAKDAFPDGIKAESYLLRSTGSSLRHLLAAPDFREPACRPGSRQSSPGVSTQLELGRGIRNAEPNQRASWEFWKCQLHFFT